MRADAAYYGHVRHRRLIGKIARLLQVWIVSDMPKTGSGKITRPVITVISSSATSGNAITLSNPEIVDDTRQQVQAETDWRVTSRASTA